MTDRILLQGLSFYGYHGVNAEEKRLGQQFVVDLCLELDLAAAGQADDLRQTVDYGEAYRCARDIVEGDARDTLEAVAEMLAGVLLARFERLVAVVIRLNKPGAPISGAHFTNVAVEIRRERLS